MERVTEIDNAFIPGSEPKYVGTKEEYRHTFSVMLQLLLYLCSEEPDIPFIEHPKARLRSSGSIPLPPGPRVWDVGVRISSAIRKYKERQLPLEDNYYEPAESGTVGHCWPRPHVRAAHWHTYWTGPRTAVFPERKPVLRWLPPIPINMDWKHEMPVAIHSVIE